MSAITVKAADMCAWGGIFLKPVFGAEGTMWENTLVRTVLALLLLAAKHGELKLYENCTVQFEADSLFHP